MKIAMLGQKGIPAHSGGVEQVVDTLSKHLVVRGHDVVAYCRRSYTPHGRTTREGRLHRVFRPSISTKHFDALSHTFFSTIDIALRRADVVHYHAIGPAALAPLARLAGMPVVVTIHGFDWQRAKWGRVAQRCLKFGERLASLAATRLTVVSPTLKDHYAARYGVTADFIPNGVQRFDFAAPTQLSRFGLEANNYLLAVGRLVPEKGLHYLLEAFQRVPGDIKLAIAGGSALDDGYERRLKQFDDPRVVFLGSADHGLLAELYSHATMFVMPSELEGMSLALLEAISMGLPVLVSDLPENTHVIGDAGFTFRARDVDHLAQRMNELLAEPAKLAQYGERAARQSERFQWPRVVDQLEALYKSCVTLRGTVRQPHANQVLDLRSPST